MKRTAKILLSLMLTAAISFGAFGCSKTKESTSGAGADTKKGEGVKDLIEAIKQVCAIGDVNAADALIYNERQRALVKQSISCVAEAIEALNMGMTLDAVTVLIEEAIGSLCELTGESVSDEVIDKVFHQFCVGK